MRNLSQTSIIRTCSILILLFISAIGTLTAQTQGIILAKAKSQGCEQCFEIGPGWTCRDTLLNVQFTDCTSGLCQKSVVYNYCVPPVEDQLTPKSGYAAPDFDAVVDSLREQLLREITPPQSIVNNITNNINMNQMVNIEMSNIVETPAVEPCPSIWSVIPFVSVLSGFTTNRAVYGRWNTGLKIGGQVRREGCRWFQYGNLNFSYWPNSFAESHCGVSCQWQKQLDLFGFQATLGVGKKIPTKNLEVYVEANSNAFFPSPSRTIYPVPDQGIYLGADWTPSEVFSLGVKIGGTQDRVGGFVQLGIFPTRVKTNR